MKKILLNNLIYVTFIFIFTISISSLFPSKAFAGVWTNNWSQNNYSIGYNVTIPIPIVDVQIDKVSTNMGEEVIVTWTSTNVSSATHCEGKINGDASDFANNNGLSYNNIGVKFKPVIPTTYTVDCYNDIPAPGTCHGTYTTPNGYCGTVGVEVAGSIGPYGELPGPYEGDLCSSLDQELCGIGWITHPCSLWHVTAPTTYNCSTLTTQSSCGTESSCSWY